MERRATATLRPVGCLICTSGSSPTSTYPRSSGNESTACSWGMLPQRSPNTRISRSGGAFCLLPRRPDQSPVSGAVAVRAGWERLALAQRDLLRVAVVGVDTRRLRTLACVRHLHHLLPLYTCVGPAGLEPARRNATRVQVGSVYQFRHGPVSGAGLRPGPPRPLPAPDGWSATR